MRTGTIPGLGWAFGLNPLAFMFLVWGLIFWLEILATGLDGNHEIVLAGWNAFRYGDGIALPVWALSASMLMRVLPADSGGFWNNSRANWWILGLSVAVSAFVWFAGPLLGVLQGRGFQLEHTVSKLYFQAVSIPVGYWLMMPLLPITATVWHRIRGHGWGSLSPWAGFWLVLLAVAVVAFLYTNFLMDWRSGVTNVPAGKVLYRWGAVALCLCVLRYLPEAVAVLSSSPAVMHLGLP